MFYHEEGLKLVKSFCLFEISWDGEGGERYTLKLLTEHDKLETSFLRFDFSKKNPINNLIITSRGLCWKFCNSQGKYNFLYRKWH